MQLVACFVSRTCELDLLNDPRIRIGWLCVFFHGLICLICFLMIQYMVYDGLCNTNMTYFVRIQQIPCFIPFPSHRH